jgi:hypothetical protein
LHRDVTEAWLNRPAVEPPERSSREDAGSAGTRRSAQDRPRKKRAARAKANQQDASNDVVSAVPAFPAELTDNHELITDLCRFSESLLDEKYIRRKWKLDNAIWQHMGNDDRFVEKIDDERLRRIGDGSAKRESAQKHVTRAPEVMAGIMNDPAANNKHRIDAAGRLDNLATGGPEAASRGERFIITINMGDDSRTYDKAIKPIEPMIEGASGTPAIIKDIDDGGQEHF